MENEPNEQPQDITADVGEVMERFIDGIGKLEARVATLGQAVALHQHSLETMGAAILQHEGVIAALAASDKFHHEESRRLFKHLNDMADVLANNADPDQRPAVGEQALAEIRRLQRMFDMPGEEAK